MRRIIFGVMLMVMGGLMLQWSLRTTSRISDSKNWPTVQGTVVSSNIARDSSRIRGGGYNKYHTVKVDYRYVVNGSSYQSDVFVFGVPKSFSNRADAERVTAAHPVGGAVTVYYDPSDPSRSCLEPGTVPPQFGLLTMMSGGCLLLGLLLFISGGLSKARASIVGR